MWDGESRVLILGSMPSPKSRAAAYSRGEHPRERQQVEEGRGGQAECGRVDGGKRHGTGDRPRNQRSDHHGTVFQIDSLCGAFGFVVAVQPTAQLVSEHDGEGLVAGERRRASRGNHGGTTCADAMTEHLDDLLQPSKHPRLGKNAGVGGGDTDSGHHSEHGEDAAAVQECGHLRILRMVTENKQPQQFCHSMCCTPTHTATEAAMLASISSRTSTRSNANTMTSNAGTRVSQCKSKADENNPPISVMLLALVETAALAEPAVAAALAAPIRNHRSRTATPPPQPQRIPHNSAQTAPHPCSACGQ